MFGRRSYVLGWRVITYFAIEKSKPISWIGWHALGLSLLRCNLVVSSRQIASFFWGWVCGHHIWSAASSYIFFIFPSWKEAFKRQTASCEAISLRVTQLIFLRVSCIVSESYTLQNQQLHKLFFPFFSLIGNRFHGSFI